MMTNGDHQGARSLLETIPDYKDASALYEQSVMEIEYRAAAALYHEKEYAAAKVIFQTLGHFHDAVMLAEECERHVDYAAAVQLADQGQWEAAIEAFIAGL